MRFIIHAPLVFTIRQDIQVYIRQHRRIKFPFILIHDYWALHAVVSRGLTRGFALLLTDFYL